MSSTNTSALSSTLVTIQRHITLVLPLMFIIFGVTGSFLNILLFSQQPFRRVSCCIYFLASSAAMFSITNIYSLTSVYAFYYRHPITYLVAFCKIFYYLNQVFSIIFRWTLAAACIDRYAMSSMATRLRRFATVRIAYRVVAIIVFLSTVVPVHNLIVYGIRGTSCTIVYGYSASLYHGILTITITTVIPGLIMVICAFLTRRNLANKRQRRQGIVAIQAVRNDNNERQRKRDQQTLAMLFSQIIFYIILTTPFTAYGIYEAISLSIENKSSERVVIEKFVFNICAILINTFPVLSFYLYTLTSSMFRKELLTMLRSFSRCNCLYNNNRVEPITIRNNLNR